MWGFSLVYNAFQSYWLIKVDWAENTAQKCLHTTASQHETTSFLIPFFLLTLFEPHSAPDCIILMKSLCLNANQFIQAIVFL